LYKQEAAMHIQVGKWGNSLAVRIPGTYAKELELEEGVELEVTRVEDGMLLRPRKRKYTLKELLKQVTPENIHGETDWGPPRGREAW
jgi:antitoxin MazE